MAVIDPKFAEELIKTINDPMRHPVHLLFNTFWKFAPDEVKQKYVADFKTNPELRAFWNEKHYAAPYEIDDLASLPTGTLGQTFYRHVVDNNLNKQLVANYKMLHDAMDTRGDLDGMPPEIKYIILRLMQTHDIHHVITGFGTTGTGEIALQAFDLAQLRFSYFGIWLSVVTTRMTYIDPDTIGPIMDAVTEGWSLGRKVRNLTYPKWEEMFARPLVDIRREFRIVPEGRYALAA